MKSIKDFLKSRKAKRMARMDNTFMFMMAVEERKSFRDKELKLIRTAITIERKRITANKNYAAKEQEVALNALDAVSRQLEVAFTNNRERLTQLGAPKKRRTSLHGVKM